MAARAWSKAEYKNDLEPQKTAACAQSKAKYKNDPEAQKVAARVYKICLLHKCFVLCIIFS